MEWIEKVKGIIGRLRRNGKTEPEIEEIVQQAADKATVTQEMERSQAEVTTVFRAPGQLLTSLVYEWKWIIPSSRQLASNNWRKLHGLPMRRKGRKRHGRTGRGCGHQ